MSSPKLRAELLAALLLLSARATWSAAAITIDQIVSKPFASDLVAAPKSAMVAWLENERGRRNIWVAGAPDWKSRKLTSFEDDDGQEIAELTWAPDASYLLFTRGGDLENGGENPNPNLDPKTPEQAIWRVDLTGNSPAKMLAVGHSPQISPDSQTTVFVRKGQIYSLAPGHDAVEMVEQKGTQANLRWSPDGRTLAFVSDRGNHSFIGLYTTTGKQLRYLDPSVDRDGEPAWSPDSTRLAFLRIPAVGRPAFFAAQREGQPWSIHVAEVQTGSSREVFRANSGPGSVFREVVARQEIFWAGDRLVFPWERTGWLHLYSLPFQGGNPVELTPGEGEVEHVALSGDQRVVYFSSNIGDIDRRHIQSVSASGNEKTKPVTTGSAIEWQPEPLADGSTFAYLTSSFNEASHPVVRLAKNQLQPLGPATKPLPLVQPQPVLITAADGLQLHGQLFLPPDGHTGSRHPALVFFHGGSRRQMLLGFHYMYYYSNAYALNQYLASQGYVVLSVNYRSGIGYGLNFREAINYGARGGSEFNDVIGAGLFLKSRSEVDGARIGVWGGSYGGYLTALALSRASDLFAAGVDFHGVHDWSSLRGYLTGGQPSGNPNDIKERQEAARIAFESSPMASVDTWRSPVLLIHGDDDRNVEFSQTSMLVEALRKRDVTFEELIFPNEIHDFLLYRHWVEAYQATADFFARKLIH